MADLVQNKSIKGKGAWYWVHNSDTGLPKAVKLRCSLCNAVFSASEHLKRGTCPNFNFAPKPISSVSPSSSAPLPPNHRKRSSAVVTADQLRFCGELTYPPASLQLQPQPQLLLPPPAQPHLMLSGGKDGLGALEMLENSVKKLKSPKMSPGPALSKTQIDSAFDFFSRLGLRDLQVSLFLEL